MSPERAELVADVAAAGAYQFGSLISAAQYFRAYDLVDAHVASGGRALDWGCGEGHFSRFLLGRGMDTTAFSLEPSCLLAAGLAERFGDRYHFVSAPAAIRGLPFADDGFDLVTSIGVLEHVRETGGDEASSLREILRVLRPGGIFLCYHFPNRWSWIEAITRHLEHKHSHPYKYSRRDVLALFAASGLELVTTKRYGLLPRLLTRYLPRALRDSKRLCAAYQACDAGLSACLPWICQNHFVVARKTAA